MMVVLSGGKKIKNIMDIKKFRDFNLNESFEDIFNKEYRYIDAVHSSLIDIIANERGISEKSFSLYDDIISEVNSLFESNKYSKFILDCEKNKYRAQYCAEIIYSKEY